MKRASEKQTVSGLRTRYIPRSRLGNGVIAMGPWVDICLLIVFFLILNSQFVIRPGVLVDLPAAEFREGTRPSRPVVVARVRAPEPRSGTEGAAPAKPALAAGQPATPPEVRPEPRYDEMVYFDDEQFVCSKAEHMVRLQQAFSRHAAQRPDQPLVILADGGIRHATMVELMDMARQSNVKRVNVATQVKP